MPVAKTIEEMNLDGGIDCLDFVNSAFDTEKEVIFERLNTYKDLLTLTDRLSLLPKKTIRNLEQLATKHPLRARRVLKEATVARQTMFKVFTAIAIGKLNELDDQNLRVLNDYLAVAISYRSFRLKNERLELDWNINGPDLRQPFWAFLLSAQDLLMNRDQQYLKKCHGCEWLFYDETKNHRRKWCDMQTCGSIEKSKRYYHNNKLKKNKPKEN